MCVVYNQTFTWICGRDYCSKHEAISEGQQTGIQQMCETIHETTVTQHMQSHPQTQFSLCAHWKKAPQKLY